jgi:hypothetical protein
MRWWMFAGWLVAGPVAGTSAQSPEPVNGRRWSIGLSIGDIHYRGGTKETPTEDGVIRFTPYRPSPVGLRAEFGGAGLRVGIGIEYAEPGLAGTGAPEPGQPATGTIVLERLLTTYTITPTFSFRLADLKGGGMIRPGLGVLLERWDLPGEPSRNRVGVLGLLTLELGLFGNWTGSATGSYGVTPSSPLTLLDLPDRYEPAALWRRGLTGAVSYRF